MAKNVSTLMGSLPIIAKMLGQRYGVKVTFGGDGAYTNGKTINLPSLPTDDPDLAELVNGYLDHEAAHCRYTDFTAQRGDNRFQNWVENALEDIRIETALSKVYPGCKQHLAGLTAKLVERGDTKPLEADATETSVLTAYILWRLRSEVLGQTALDDLASEAGKRFDECFPRGTKTKLTALMGEVRGCDSTENVIALAARIVELLKQEQEENSEPDESQDADDAGDTSDSGDDQDSASNGQSDSDADDDSQTSNGAADSDTDDNTSDGDKGGDEDEADSGESDSDADSDDDGQASDGSADSDADSQDEDGAGTAGDNSSGEDDQTRRESLKKAMNGDEADFEEGAGEKVAKALEDEANNHPFDDAQVAEPVDPSPLDLSYGAIDDRKVRQASARLRSRLAGLIQAQTLEHYSRVRTGKRIDRRMLPRIGHGDPKLFTAVEETPGVDTAVTVLLDASASMGGSPITVAREAALAAAYALEETEGTNTSVFSFPDGRDPDRIKTLHRRGQRINPDHFCVAADGPCTPLANAAWGAAWDLLCANEPRKMLIVITDGDPDSLARSVDVMERMRGHGVETIGVGINMDIPERLMPESKTISDVAELSNALFSILEKKLVL